MCIRWSWGLAPVRVLYPKSLVPPYSSKKGVYGVLGALCAYLLTILLSPALMLCATGARKRSNVYIYIYIHIFWKHSNHPILSRLFFNPFALRHYSYVLYVYLWYLIREVMQRISRVFVKHSISSSRVTVWGYMEKDKTCTFGM